MPAADTASPLAAATARRRWWRRLVPAAALLLALAAVEIYLRVDDRRRDEQFWTLRMPDPVRGWALRPSYAGWVLNENRVWVEINSDGMRDREHPVEKPPGTLRVAVLGDSYMQASNVPLEKAFVSFFERRLSGCLQPSRQQAEVLNFGVSGYGTAQELLTYRHHVIKYKPDIVVLAVYTSNDIFNNHRAITESPGDDNPYFVLDGDDLVLDTGTTPGDEAGQPFYQRVRLAITNRSLAAARVYRGWADFRARFLPVSGAAPATPGGDEDDESGIDSDDVYRVPEDPDVVDAWRVTEALFLALARETAAQGTELWIVTLTNAEQVDPSLTARKAFAASLGVDSLVYPDLRIRDFARAHGIPVVTLVEPLGDYAELTGTYLNGGYNEAVPAGKGHWNETANQLAAEVVGSRMCAGSRAIAGLQ